jgi:Chlorophyllase
VQTFYPSKISNDSSHPLIVFSIGGGYVGLSVADYVPFLQYLASNGYIVCAANADPLTTRHIGVIAETEAANLILNYSSLPTFPLANAVNLEAIGAVGHSRGGESVIVQAATDNRIKVILAMGAENSTDAMANYTYVNVPALLIFGSEDSSAPLNDNINYYNNFNDSKEYIQINGANHDLGIWNGTAYGFPYNLTTTPTTEKYVLSWFNYYLYSNSTAINVFNGTGLTNDVSAGIISKYAVSIRQNLQLTGAATLSQLAIAFVSMPVSITLFGVFLYINSVQRLTIKVPRRLKKMIRRSQILD